MPGYLIRTANFVAEIQNDDELIQLAQVGTIQKDTMICVQPGKSWTEAKKVAILRKIWGLEAGANVPPPIAVGASKETIPSKTKLPPTLKTTVSTNPLLEGYQAALNQENAQTLVSDKTMPSCPPQLLDASKTIPEDECQDLASSLVIAVQDEDDLQSLMHSSELSSSSLSCPLDCVQELASVSHTWELSDGLPSRDSAQSNRNQEARELSAQNLDEFVRIEEENEDQTRAMMRSEGDFVHQPQTQDASDHHCVSDEDYSNAAPQGRIIQEDGVTVPQNSQIFEYSEPRLEPPMAMLEPPMEMPESPGQILETPENAPQMILDAVVETSDLADEIQEVMPAQLEIEHEQAPTFDASKCVESQEQSEAPIDANAQALFERMRWMAQDEIREAAPDEVTCVIESENVEKPNETHQPSAPNHFDESQNIEIDISLDFATETQNLDQPLDAGSAQNQRVANASQTLGVSQSQGSNAGFDAMDETRVFDKNNAQISNDVRIIDSVSAVNVSSGNYHGLNSTDALEAQFKQMDDAQVQTPELEHHSFSRVPSGDDIEALFDSVDGHDPRELEPHTRKNTDPLIRIEDWQNEKLERELEATLRRSVENPEDMRTRVRTRHHAPQRGRAARSSARDVAQNLDLVYSAQNQEQDRHNQAFEPLLENQNIRAPQDANHPMTGWEELAAARDLVKSAIQTAAQNGGVDFRVLKKAVSFVEAIDETEENSIDHAYTEEDDENPSDIFRIRSRCDIDLTPKTDRVRIDTHASRRRNEEKAAFVDEDNSSDRFKIRGGSELRKMLAAEIKAAAAKSEQPLNHISTQDYCQKSGTELRKLFEKQDELHLFLGSDVRDKESQFARKEAEIVTQSLPQPAQDSGISNMPVRSSVVVVPVKREPVEPTAITTSYDELLAQQNDTARAFVEEKLYTGEEILGHFDSLYLTTMRVFSVSVKKDNVQNYEAFDLESIQSSGIHEGNHWYLLVSNIILFLAAIILFVVLKHWIWIGCLIWLGIMLPVCYITSFRKTMRFNCNNGRTITSHHGIKDDNSAAAKEFATLVDRTRQERKRRLAMCHA